MFLTIFCIFVLCLPTVWALWDDRNGDTHPNKDLYTVFTAICVSSLWCALIAPETNIYLDLFRSFCFSLGIYVSIFPYAVNYMLWRRGILNTKSWWNHLSKTAWPDRLPLWAGTPWPWRMFFGILILFGSSQIYFCPGEIISYGNCCFCSFVK